MNLLTKTLVVAGAALLPIVGHAAARTKAHRITPAQAEASATRKIHGKALSAKYEFEDGRWQYAVLVKNGSGLYEVEVNAQTGKVTDSERTSAGEEAKEAAADKKAAKH
ncbi:MAG: PepSY domain-containing protein [Armatimonadota bacterium]|nr:PepSY domain-containing protein [Armatimonadota bacterium]